MRRYTVTITVAPFPPHIAELRPTLPPRSNGVHFATGTGVIAPTLARSESLTTLAYYGGREARRQCLRVGRQTCVN